MITTPNFRAVEDGAVVENFAERPIMSFVGINDADPVDRLHEVWGWANGREQHSNRVFIFGPGAGAVDGYAQTTFITLGGEWILLPDGRIVKRDK